MLRAAARTADRGLRLFGAPGRRVADALGGQVAHLLVRLTDVLAPLARRWAWLVRPAAPHVRLVAGLARSYLLHLLLRTTIRSTIVRLLVEGVLMPLLVNSRLGQSLRSVVAPPHPSPGTAGRKTGPEVEADLAATEAGPRPADLRAGDTETPDVASAPDEDEEPPAAPEPLNRAERRAQQRQQARNRRTPRPT